MCSPINDLKKDVIRVGEYLYPFAHSFTKHNDLPVMMKIIKRGLYDPYCSPISLGGELIFKHKYNSVASAAVIGLEDGLTLLFQIYKNNIMLSKQLFELLEAELFWQLKTRKENKPSANYLVGLKEAAEISGIPKATLAVYIKRGFPGGKQFPEPIQRLASGPVWRKSDIEKFRDSPK